MDIQLDQERKIYSVSQLVQSVRWQLETNFSSVWVEGELSSFTHHSSGHMYFSIKDGMSTLSCVMFKRDNARIKFVPEQGLSVLIHGTMTVYAPRGQSQFVADIMEPKGLGMLQLAFEQTKKKLEQEGLFDDSRKRPIPRMPKVVGIVTSESGAVFHDILNVLNRRFPDAHLILAPSAVQGEGAKERLVQAIEDLNEHGVADVLILARGGGSLEDLWAFNEEVVARAIADSRIPVISAVGHEVDYTIADFVADLRAPTPSAAAEIVLPEKQVLLKVLKNIDLRIKRGLSLRLEESENRLERLLKSKAFLQPQSLIDEKTQQIDDLTDQAAKETKLLIEKYSEKTQNLIFRLKSLHPEECLKRGYSIVFDEHKERIIKSSNQIGSGDEILIQMSDGWIQAVVTQKLPESSKKS
ncbi:MAG: exodeoxyribonuclease VII large subunit [Candidatus Omnitrophica bacterium]|nr:exodeoxyribonuclease VII large subunit [Candidatus Omnitrophota bacterium]